MDDVCFSFYGDGRGPSFARRYGRAQRRPATTGNATRQRLVLLLALGAGCGGTEEAARPVGYVAEHPAGLPEFVVERRNAAIAEAVEQVLAVGEDGIRARYAQVSRYMDTIDSYAAEYGVDTMRIAAIIARESMGDPAAKSPVGAVGLMQLMPATAIGEGAACGLMDAAQRTDPERNICTGTSYYASLIAQYGGDSETALARYNFGGLDAKLAALPADAVRSVWTLHGLNHLPRETAAYVPLVLAWEAVFRFLVHTNAVPVVAVEVIDAPAFRVADAGTGRERRTHRIPRRPGRVIAAMPYAVTTVEEQPQPVWYAARDGDTYIGVVFVALSDPDPAAIDALNPYLAVDGLSPGALLMLPPDRYAFHVASGRASYAAIAHAHGMAAATLLRWNGRWTNAAVARARFYHCAHQGCDDGDEVPIEGTPLLVHLPEPEH